MDTAPTEFEINGELFRATKLSARDQFHVSRRIAPLLPALGPIFLQLAQSGKKGGAAGVLAHPELLQPLADSLASMSDDTADYVLDKCLSVVRIKRSDTWAALWNPAAKLAMFADMDDMGKLLPIVIRVIQDSLGSFTNGFLTSQKEPPPVKA